MACARGLVCHAVSFRYGQRHAVELEAAARIAAAFQVASFRTIEIDLAGIGGSALTGGGDGPPVPKNRTEGEIGAGIPVTYVPARNTIFVAFAMAVAEVTGAREIIMGINAVDYSGYPDCRPEWLEAVGRVVTLGTKAGVEGRGMHVTAPLLRMTKKDIILAGTALGVDYGLTVSCYDPDAAGHACGACDSCTLRRRGFLDAGIADPTRYRR